MRLREFRRASVLRKFKGASVARQRELRPPEDADLRPTTPPANVAPPAAAASAVSPAVAPTLAAAAATAAGVVVIGDYCQPHWLNLARARTAIPKPSARHQ